MIIKLRQKTNINGYPYYLIINTNNHTYDFAQCISRDSDFIVSLNDMKKIEKLLLQENYKKIK